MNLKDYNLKDLIGLPCTINHKFNGPNLKIQGIQGYLILVSGIENRRAHVGIIDAKSYDAGGPSDIPNCWWLAETEVTLLEKPESSSDTKDDPNLFNFNDL